MEDPLICSICYNMYNSQDRRPFLGTCGHSFCEACTQEISQLSYPAISNRHKCPFCHKRTFEEPRPNHLAIEILVLLDKAQADIAAEINEIVAKADQQSENNNGNPRTIIEVKNIPLNWAETTVREHFRSYGEIKNVFFGTIENEGKVTVEFARPEDAEIAIGEMNKRDMGGMKLNVTYKKPAITKKKPKTSSDRVAAFREVAKLRLNMKKHGIHVRNLGYITEKELTRQFGPGVKRVVVFKDNRGIPTGEAYIYFDSNQAVENALERNCKPFGLLGPKITVERIVPN